MRPLNDSLNGSPIATAAVMEKAFNNAKAALCKAGA